MLPSKQIPLEKCQIIIFKVVSYFNSLIVMTINNSVEKCDSNLNLVVIIECVFCKSNSVSLMNVKA